MVAQTKFVALGLVALVMGLALAVPLLQSNLKVSPSVTFERPFITFDVAYAYFSLPSYSQNVTGLWRNNNSLPNSGLLNYVIVVNITNYSNITVVMDGVTVYAAEHMSTTNSKVEFSQISNGQFLVQNIGFDPYNTLIPDKALPYLGPYQSKLFGLSGTTAIDNATILQSGVFYVGGKVDGSVPNFNSDWYSTWGGSKQVHAQSFGNEYLYNNLISANQTLILQGLNVYIR